MRKGEKRCEDMRITVIFQGEKREISCEKEESILSACQRQMKGITAVCGGKGLCGKCRILLINGTLPVTESDRRYFRQEELEAGYRLACRAFPEEDCTIELCFAEENGFEVLMEFSDEANRTEYSEIGTEDRRIIGTELVGLAVDIGTTTLAAKLVNLEDGRVLGAASCINHQRTYGADVISRIEAEGAGKGRELQEKLHKDLEQITQKLLARTGRKPSEICRAVISGNTTMGHLLMGYSCKTLGVYPFTPVNIGTISAPFSSLTGTENFGGDGFLVPGISAFVGGDIVSGLYACGFHQKNSVNLLVDLGTNGEMAVGNRHRILVTSAAAGPAFEGGNISCGTGSIPGAICHVKIGPDRMVKSETIQDQTPVGICGTGVIEMTAELLKAGIVDETGLLDEEYFDEGYPVAITANGQEITFTQRDIREVQLAKAAVRAGIETLVLRYGVSWDEIDHIYLAGGMGFQMDRDAAVAIGLFPEKVKDRIHTVGNSSLEGAVRALKDSSWQETMEGIVRISEETALAKDRDFQEFYMQYMLFLSQIQEIQSF